MKVKKTKYEIFVEIVCLTSLIGTLMYLIFDWRNIPAMIPGHYNSAGQIDRMGSKTELYVMLIVAWIMYIGMSVIERYPNLWNTGVTVTEKNKEQVYRILKSMLITTKLIMTIVFVYLVVNSSLAIALPSWFLTIFIIIEFGTIIYFMIKLSRVNK